MKHTLFTLLFGAALLSASLASADVSLFNLFTDHMVIQRDKPARIWGWAEPSEAITVEFAGQTVATRADEHGDWLVELKPLSANAVGADLIVRGNNTLTLHDVLVGDVWLCSGQSNMEMTLSRDDVQHPERHLQIEPGVYPPIRQIKIEHKTAPYELRNIVVAGGGWQLPTEATLTRFTAAGYHFAAEIFRNVGVPIGLLNSNWSGCRIEPFIAYEGLYETPGLEDVVANLNREKFDVRTPEGKSRCQQRLSQVQQWAEETKQAFHDGKEIHSYGPFYPPEFSFGKYHQAMIAPLTRAPIKGILWYQGCSNAGDPRYYQYMHALTAGWRKAWGEELPFYFVQLAAFRAANDQPYGDDNNGWAALRMHQFQSLDIPHSGMAVAIDIGDAGNIHPRNKYDVGKRLALWALRNEYGFNDTVTSGPLYRSMTLEGATIRLAFDSVGSGLMIGEKKGYDPTVEVTEGTLKRFSIAGEDRVWHWAEAKIDGNTVVVSSPDVPAPVAVRYAYANNPEGANLYNREGLPASPFRTDDW